MRRLGFALLAAGILLIGGSALLHTKLGSLGTPAAVFELERTLARPGLLALVTLNVRALIDLEVAESGDWNESFLAAGIDLERDVSHATLALNSHESGEARAAIAFVGRFDPSAIERAIREHPDFSVADAEAAGERTLTIQRIDPETCEKSGPWALHLTSDRLLIAKADEIGSLLTPPAGAESVLRDLSRFHSFRAGKLVSGAVFVPDQLPKTDNFLVGMAAQSASQQVQEFRAVYVGAAPRLIPPGIEIDALFEGLDAATTAEKAAAWQAAIERFQTSLEQGMPTLARLLAGLEIYTEGANLHAELQLAMRDLEGLRDLPAEVGASLFGGAFEATAAAATDEQIDESPLTFVAEVARDALADYDPNVAFAGATDATAGPVGVRLSALRRLPGTNQNELEIEAFATGVPNLGDRGERVAIEVTSVAGEAGQELLAVEHCGADRNDRPAPLAPSFGHEVQAGSKKVRLAKGVSIERVAKIAGRATIRLPVRTESVRIRAAAGEAIERGGARLEITRAAGGSFSYRVSGEEGALLHLRGLNAAGRPLSGRGSTSSTSPFHSGSSGSRQFAGELHEVEAIFAIEEAVLQYPFELTGHRPGTDGEHLAQRAAGDDPEAPALVGAIEDMLEELAASFSQTIERVIDGSDEPLASTRTGPFLVTLEGIWTIGGLMPRLQVQAPKIPGVADSPTALELRLDEVRLTDGSVHTGEWSDLLSMGEGFGTPGLRGSTHLQTGVSGSQEDLASLRGAVSIQLPESVATQDFATLEPGAELELPELSVQLVEIGRDRFTLRARRNGERVLGARAFNDSGDELWIPHTRLERTDDGSFEIQFQVKGVPQRIELRYAERLARAEYPFVLTNGRQRVAQATR